MQDPSWLIKKKFFFKEKSVRKNDCQKPNILTMISSYELFINWQENQIILRKDLNNFSTGIYGNKR